MLALAALRRRKFSRSAAASRASLVLPPPFAGPCAFFKASFGLSAAGAGLLFCGVSFCMAGDHRDGAGRVKAAA